MSYVFKFPIRVAFDENSKVRRIPGPPVMTETRKHPRAAHRNIILSDESGTSTPDDGESEEDFAPQPEEPAAEVIAVAFKRVLPDESDKKPPVLTGTPIKSPLTQGSSAPSTSLAFRGSPEKPQHIPPTIDVGYVE